MGGMKIKITPTPQTMPPLFFLLIAAISNIYYRELAILFSATTS